MRSRSRSGSIALLGSLLVVGCGDDAGSDGGGDTEVSSSGEDDGSTGMTSATVTASTDDATAESGDSSDGAGPESSGASADDDSTGAAPSCGDGIVDDGEACDDANDVDGDGCNSDCVVSGTVQWELLYDGPGELDDCAHDVDVNADGVLALGGETKSADEDAYDGLTLSISSDGRVLWDASHDSVGDPESQGGQTDRIYGVAIDDDGNVVVAGHEYLDIETVWVSKLDLGGATLWTRTGAETHAGRGYGATVTDSGDVYIVGTHGLYAFISHYDPDGVEIWTEERKGTDGCNGCDSFWRVGVAANGDPIVGGQLDNASSDAYLGRFFANTGADDWSFVLDSAGMGHDGVSAIGITDTSALALFYWSDDVTETSELRSYTLGGELEWVRPDPLEGVLSFDFATTSDGGVVLIGDAWADATGITTIVTRFDVEGDVAWTQELPSAAGGYQQSRGIVVAQDGRIAVAGCKTDPVAAPSGDAWLVMLAP